MNILLAGLNLVRHGWPAPLNARGRKHLARALQSVDAPSPRQECPVIVVGMHRSGTSLTARLLEDLGVKMGRWQAKGTSEALFFRRRNQMMLSLVRAAWDRPAPLIRALDDAHWRRAVTSVVARDLGTLWTVNFAPPAGLAGWLGNWKAPWGFKDPRNCLTLPVWLAIFPNAKVVHVVRHGKAVASSLVRRARKQVEQGATASAVSLDGSSSLDLWAEYVLNAHEHCASVASERFLEVRYENLLDAPAEVVTALAEFAGVPANEGRVAAAASRVDGARNAASVDSHPTPRVEQALALYDYPI